MEITWNIWKHHETHHSKKGVGGVKSLGKQTNKWICNLNRKQHNAKKSQIIRYHIINIIALCTCLPVSNSFPKTFSRKTCWTHPIVPFIRCAFYSACQLYSLSRGFQPLSRPPFMKVVQISEVGTSYITTCLCTCLYIYNMCIYRLVPAPGTTYDGVGGWGGMLTFMWINVGC